MTEDLRVRMLDDLRSRGVWTGYPARRADRVDQALRGCVIDGRRVEITAADWRDVIAFVDQRYASNLELLGGILARALEDAENWIDVLAGARSWGGLRAAAATDDGAGRHRADARMTAPRRPCHVCLLPDGCGGAIAEWWDQHERDVGMRGRWFCGACGLEWTTGPRGGALPITCAEPWAGCDPEHWTTRPIIDTDHVTPRFAASVAAPGAASVSGDRSVQPEHLIQNRANRARATRTSKPRLHAGAST